MARAYGPARTLQTLFKTYVFGDQEWYVFHKALERVAALPAPDGFTYRLATALDADRLGVFEPYRPHQQFRDWIDDGETLLFLVLDGDDPVAFNCVGRRPLTPPFSVLPRASHEVWVKDSYALHAFRQRHISARLLVHRDHALRERGIREVVAAVLRDNIASLRLSNNANVARVERVRYLRVAGLGWTWIERDASARLQAHLREAAAAVRPAPRG
jgi:hypothetical protein